MATDGKGAINEAIKETEATTALGEAIRARADVLRADRLPYPAPNALSMPRWSRWPHFFLHCNSPVVKYYRSGEWRP